MSDKIGLDQYKGTPIEKGFQKGWTDKAREAAIMARHARLMKKLDEIQAAHNAAVAAHPDAKNFPKASPHFFTHNDFDPEHLNWKRAIARVKAGVEEGDSEHLIQNMNQNVPLNRIQLIYNHLGVFPNFRKISPTKPKPVRGAKKE